jgi:dipeptide/tripeptide permease
MKSHPIATLPYYFAIVFERAGYYGMRSIFVIYLTGVIGLSDSTALRMYGAGIGYMMLSNFIGGAIGFFGQPKIAAVAGVALQAIGVFIIALGQYSDQFYLGFVLVGVGGGISRTNFLPFLGQLYHRSKLLDAGLMINYTMVNVGAFIGSLLVGLIAYGYGYQTAFFICGFMYLFAIGLLLFAKSTESDPFQVPEKPNTMFPLIVALAIIGVAVYWLAMEFVGGELFYYSQEIKNNALAELVAGNALNINTVVVILTAVALAIYFSIKQVSTTMQLAIGFGLAAFGYLLLAPVNIFDPNMAFIGGILMGFHIIQSVAEVFLGPPVTAYIIRKLDVRYSPMALAAFFFVSSLLMKLPFEYKLDKFSLRVMYAVFAMLVFTGVFVGFYLNRKKHADHKAQQLDDEFDF